MHYEIKLDLILSGFTVDPGRISSILALEPSRFWLKGDQIQNSALKRKTNGWVLSSGLNKNAEFETHLQALLEKIEPMTEKFQNLPASTQTELSCAVYIYHGCADEEEHNTPALHLDSRAMDILIQIHAEYDIDLYVLPD